MIYLDKYISSMSFWKPHQTAFECNPDFGFGHSSNKDDFQIYWGGPKDTNIPHAIIETGFFWNAAHIDTCGLYDKSSLAEEVAIKHIDEFEAPESAENVILSQVQASKYQQGEDPDMRGKQIYWDGVVLALQNPTDRSIRAVSTPEKYYQFVEDACKFYGKNLFIKLHPWNSGEIGDKLRAIAAKYNVRAAKINHRILSNCKFCLVYNSTFAVDCMLRGVPVAQYAKGYFYRNPAVHYTYGSFPTDIKTNLDFGKKTCDFLVWKYCFNYNLTTDEWIKLFKAYRDSKGLFPLPKELSYAGKR